ncbi:CidA/LrgA family protein [Sulfurospirillum barnesii]|uniref:Putative effector of murein hydrolase LrgA n=1 Tax=Sulfurospirillum barnesii (strain ATCC 700032 / DSM 10660 / SES-3) TaxID=760154 RepID=I3XVW3_SULBS|nr:CidA/LrgA family protein [Sulfurospirillum barnesii]AFL68087.1 putative effector of murein hydrolase LrgA [Sulfurospirillum barnesii SES-3]
MLKGILTLLVFQFIGECLVKLFEFKIPGAIIGMILLLLFLMVKKSSFHALDNSVFWLLRYLPLFIFPSAVGIMTQFDTLRDEAFAITCSLIVSTFIALGLSAKLMDILITKHEQRHEH